MPSRGKDLHQYLKMRSIQKLAEMHGDELESLFNEQPQKNPDGSPRYGRSPCTFKVSVEVGAMDYRHSDAHKMYFPDIVATLRTLIPEKKGADGETSQQKIIIECETSGNSTLVNGNSSLRNYGYMMFKEKYKELVKLILVVPEGMDVKNEMWDEVWKFKIKED